MKIAFSKPTRTAEEQQILFSRFRSFGYNGLQLKNDQYCTSIALPSSFIDRWGSDAPAIASGVITGGRLDEMGMAELRTLFTFAQAVRSERVIFCHAQPRQGLSNADIQGFARILSELGKEAQQHGITLSLHHHYDQPVMYRQDFEVFFEAVGDQCVKLTIDTAHLVKSGITNIVEIFRDYHQVIDNVHLKDIAHGEFKVPGQGNINFTPVFSAFREIKFAGWLCADEESGSDLLAAMETCAQFITSHRA
jgi:sugar phosphate isomerase/epimerase